MKDKVDLSIIITSYNTQALVQKCLESIYRSLKRSDLTYEVIIIENGSTDRSVELIQKRFSNVVLITNNTNVGFGRANNQGVEKARGEVILLLNSDTEVIDDGIEKLYQYFKILSPDSIVGGKLFNTDGTPQSSCGPAYSLVNVFIALFLKGDYLKITRYSPDIIKQVDWVMGACMMLSKGLYRSTGGFDEEIFMYMEEIDFEYRAKKAGGQIFFYPEARFAHVGAGSSQGRTEPILNVFRGLKYFYNKHYSFIPNAILRIILVLKSLLAIALFTVMNKKTDQKLYLKALRISVT